MVPWDQYILVQNDDDIIESTMHICMKISAPESRVTVNAKNLFGIVSTLYISWRETSSSKQFQLLADTEMVYVGFI